MARCKECGKGKLKVIGTCGMPDDLIEVECQNPDCGEMYALEPDGLGEGGMEWVDAKMLDQEKEEL